MSRFSNYRRCQQLASAITRITNAAEESRKTIDDWELVPLRMRARMPFRQQWQDSESRRYQSLDAMNEAVMAHCADLYAASQGDLDERRHHVRISSFFREDPEVAKAVWLVHRQEADFLNDMNAEEELDDELQQVLHTLTKVAQIWSRIWELSIITDDE